jgi:hypothetical protein
LQDWSFTADIAITKAVKVETAFESKSVEGSADRCELLDSTLTRVDSDCKLLASHFTINCVHMRSRTVTYDLGALTTVYIP